MDTKRGYSDVKKVKIKELKHIGRIDKYGDRILCMGRHLYIFSTDGNLIADRNDIPNPAGLAFLKDQRILVDGGRNKYHILSLIDGTTIGEIAWPKKDYCTGKFAVDAEENFAYEYHWVRENLFISRIDLSTFELENWKVDRELRATYDLMCDKKGILCLLQGHLSDINGRKVSENGILYQYPDYFEYGNYGSSNYWKARWQFEGERFAQMFFRDTDHVLTGDLHVFNVQNGEDMNLLENSSDYALPPQSPNRFYFDENNRFLTIVYLTGQIIVDCNLRKVVAQYAISGSDGCVIDNEYWFGTESGIVRKPFPQIEELPKSKNYFF